MDDDKPLLLKHGGFVNQQTPKKMGGWTYRVYVRFSRFLSTFPPWTPPGLGSKRPQQTWQNVANPDSPAKQKTRGKRAKTVGVRGSLVTRTVFSIPVRSSCLDMQLKKIILKSGEKTERKETETSYSPPNHGP